MKQERAGTPITVGEVKIIPLERVSISHQDNKTGFVFFLQKEPIGVVVSSQQGQWAIDIQGKSIPLEQYVRQIDGLKDLLDTL